MEGKTYFQFPLCALAYGDSVEERLNTIISYACIECGAKFMQKLSPNAIATYQRVYADPSKGLRGFSPDNRVHLAAVIGAEQISFHIGSLQSLIARYQRFSRYVRDYEARQGRDCLVRIEKSLVFEVRDNGRLSYREFCVLAAIYSVLGDKKYSRITQERIRCRSLGYKSAKAQDAEMRRRLDGARPLTEKELRNTIDKLHMLRFFARSTYARRISYYSNRLSVEEMADAIVKRKVYPDDFRAKRREIDQRLTERIRSARKSKRINEDGCST